VSAAGSSRNVAITATNGQAFLGAVSATGTADVTGVSVDVSSTGVSLTSATATNGSLSLVATSGDVLVDTASATGGDATITASNNVKGRVNGGRAAITANNIAV